MIMVVTPERWRGLHAETDPACWCGPRIEPVEGGKMLVHEHPDDDTMWLCVHYPEITLAEA